MVEVNNIMSLSITHGENAEHKLYRLKRDAVLRIHPSASLLGRHVALFCNYPSTGEFTRDRYTNLIWYDKNGKSLTTDAYKFVNVEDLAIYCEIKTNIAGTFHFYFLYEDCKLDGPRGSMYVQIEPKIKVGPPKESKVMTLDSIRCQTVLAKLLGPITTWESKLRVAKESGYNMIHFTPIQELGGSRSGYSLRNQLAVNPEFGAITEFHEEKLLVKHAPVSFDDVAKITKKMREEWGIASICDIVLNHTANESKWIRDYPESSYSCFTCPHLRPAFLLDALYSKIGEDVAAGLLEHVGVPRVVETEQHLDALRHQIHTTYLPMIKVHELYQCDVERIFKIFKEEIQKVIPTPHQDNYHVEEMHFEKNTEFRRLGVEIDLERAIKIYNVFRPDCYDEDSRLKKCAEKFRSRLEELNEAVRCDIQNHLNGGVENCLSGVRYERVQGDGPQVKEISIKHPLFQKYFTRGGTIGKPLPEIEDMMYHDLGKFFMAHNGWVMNGNPLQDFARPQAGTGNVYLRRELIAWGDSVKLRFGDKPEDSPYLWNHMREYVETTAKLFHGVRLDNCHSTPLHVAEYMLDSARRINPELYVVAELFTNSDNTDNIFVNRLGITSLIREALSAWDSHEEGRLVYRYGGAPVGAFFSSPKRLLDPNIAHALFMDLTHDNPSPVEKRSAFDLLPSSALVAMTCCATGSNRGYDELVPHHIHVVDEERQYQEWDRLVSATTGIISAKRALNVLHGELAEQGYNQLYVDQMDPNIVAVTRHNVTTHQSIILVAHTSFSYPNADAGPTTVRPLRFEGFLEEIILEAQISHKTGKPFNRPVNYIKNVKYINGLTEYNVELSEHIQLEKSKIFSHTAKVDGNFTELSFENLKPGSVVAIRVSLNAHVRPHIAKLQELVSNFHNEKGPKYYELVEIGSKLNLFDFNRALFSCDQEERDLGFGGSAYDIPGYGALVYCGLQGVVSVLADVAPHNDLGHWICGNLRDGNWLIDYIHQRLSKIPGTEKLGKYLEVNLQPLKEIPRYMIPSYFDVIITGVHSVLFKIATSSMSEFVKNGTEFVHLLAMGSLQFMNKLPSANLPELSSATKAPKPPKHFATFAAGLPHFATGYMRCWGRDTFIALRGLLLLTGRYDEARYIILGFANTLRHGLIPNLLDSGNPRFNCRDAVWWWLYCIKEYVTEVPNGASLLTEKVSRLFPTDESPKTPANKCDQFLHEVVHEALSVHFQGLIFRERNAGRQIDEHMTEKGFNNQIGINPDTGFVFGGNEANCGTWMDKMGSSDKAGNRGKPSTPRDGSAVELVGLQMAVLRFLQKMSKDKAIPQKHVERVNKDGSKTKWSFEEWANKISANYEKYCFVGPDDKNPLVNKKGIYKDTFNSSQPWTDYQLRCNFPIAMVVAPEMFNPKHAWEALTIAKAKILGPLGMCTLDPDDWSYNGTYNNDNDSNDARLSHGANYHQGPEWVWPVGFYLRARLMFAEANGVLEQTIAETWGVLTNHLKELQTSHWRGLPELTNERGAYCSGSCRTQAWSMSTILEVLYDLKQLEKRKK